MAIRGHQLLICWNVRSGYGYLPGGHVEPDEGAAEALAREFREETGEAVLVRAHLLTAEVRFCQGQRTKHEIDLMFHVEHPAGWAEDVRTMEPEIRFEWVDVDQLESADVRPTAVVQRAVELLLRARGDGGREVGAGGGWVGGEDSGGGGGGGEDGRWMSLDDRASDRAG